MDLAPVVLGLATQQIQQGSSSTPMGAGALRTSPSHPPQTFQNGLWRDFTFGRRSA